LLLIANLVVPELLAANRSPLFVLLTIKEAFDPIPPDIESGAGVEALPTNTDELKSCERIRFPVPLAVRVRLSSLTVEIVAAAPPPILRVVESILRVAAASIVVSPVAVSVVSDESNIIELFPELNVIALAPPEVISPAPIKSRESISRTVPSIVMFPRLALSSIVIDPEVALTSNSEKLIAVAPPLIDVRDVPLRVVVLFRLTVSELRERIDPDAPLRGDILMFPVVAPPRVRVLLRRDWIVLVEALSESPLLLVVAERVAVGVPFATPVIANLALVVELPPIAKSTV